MRYGVASTHIVVWRPWAKRMPHSSLGGRRRSRSEEHTSELQSHSDLVCRLLLDKISPRRSIGVARDLFHPSFHSELHCLRSRHHLHCHSPGRDLHELPYCRLVAQPVVDYLELA